MGDSKNKLKASLELVNLILFQSKHKMASLYLFFFFVTLVLRFGLGYNTSHLFFVLFFFSNCIPKGGRGHRKGSPDPSKTTAPSEDLQTFTHKSEAIKHPSVFFRLSPELYCERVTSARRTICLLVCVQEVILFPGNSSLTEFVFGFEPPHV